VRGHARATNDNHFYKGCIITMHKLKQPIAGVLYLHDITKEKMGDVGIQRGFMKHFTKKNYC
jgi:hypothetical protein